MPKEKPSGSAAERRAQERQQRERREEVRVSTRSNKGIARGPMVRKQDRSGLYMAIGALVLVAAVIGGLVFYNQTHQPPAPGANPNFKRAPADTAVIKQLTSVSQSTWEAVGTGGVKNPFTTTSGQPFLKGPDGHPQFMYVGAEFCPYCAAERWSMINALSRFGKFSNLSQLQSYEYSIPTFSFYKSGYSSQYVDFAPVEVNGNGPDKANPNQYVSLEKMTPEQEQIFKKLNTSQSFPFVNVGNQYTAVGASYDPTVLLDSSSQPRSWQDIANALSDPKSTLSKDILGTANYMTAAICSLTNQQPGNVCSSSVIQQIEHTLGKPSSTASTSSPAELVAVERRKLA